MFPGQNYPTTMPVMTFLKQALADSGWRIIEVSWDFPKLQTRADAVDFVERVAERAVEFALANFGQPRRLLLITKSISTLLAAWAAPKQMYGVWLTPLISASWGDTSVSGALRSMDRPQLLVGTELDDLSWSEVDARDTGCDILAFSGVNHAFIVPGKWKETLGVVDDVTSRVLEYLDET
ncbi:hypothetical protein [Haematomicrobium sanguinis]|uniref:hypothetical protein n=1 Tax=Haematomicrobium sanguinis TaxID=479106 RepID=UPI000A84353E|nr:hypothetical protein [Haematomicrobium sanguinis]